jgi:KaiC/GvpD/RAD55 family RecA-like ATPase
MPNFLRFGIPSLDKLIGSHDEGHYGIKLTPNEKGQEIEDATGICIMGPDGTGKSVFALHLASQYLADCLDEKAGNSKIELPNIYYISTDLNHGKATKIWNNFALNGPFDRRVPFEKVEFSPDADSLKETEITLEPYNPQNVVKYNSHGEDRRHKVCFIDLAATTAGDDWGFVHRLLALMQQPVKGHPRHLVIIDAIEGFETYVGQLDAFGEASSRRARIAQLARLAVKKTHMLLIVEEMRMMERLPEEFVTDIVIRLRNVESNKYLRRTVEIEKARGQSLVRGQHPFSIRKGKGSTTGSQDNVDDPEILSLDGEAKKREVSTGNEAQASPRTKSSDKRETDYPYQDYVQVFPSLNYINRAIMELTHAPRESPPKNKYAAFGIRYLDNMLGGEGFEAVPNADYTDTRGLPCGTVTALIGDSLTQKTRLGRSFLSRCFFPFTEPAQFDPVVKALTGDEETNKTLEEIKALRENRERTHGQLPLEPASIHRKLRDLKKKITNYPAAEELLKKCGVAVLFTTLDTHHEALADEFLDRGLSVNMKVGSDERLIAEILMESRTICRRMEIHDVPASVLAHIFERNIRKAQDILDRESQSNPSERFKNSKRIRVVFDDFNAFRNTYHEVREDPLFLPYLLFFLGREGVTTLIVDTQSISRPDLTLTERYESELRELVQHRLYTWRVPFYGDNRVAITAIPPFSPSTSGAIRELRWESIEDAGSSQGDNLSLGVSPHFELYTGLEEGKLRPVPIEIRFYAESKAFKRYLEAEEVTFAELFVPYKREGQTDKAKVLFPYGTEDYNLMRDFSSLQRGTRLDHTLVFQIDEFWRLRRPKAGRIGAFRPQWDYLTTPTWENSTDSRRDAVADPYAIFQPVKGEVDELKGKVSRLDFYDEKNVPYVVDYKDTDNETHLKKELDRVPFSWDFGFLLCKANAWEDAAQAGLEIFRERAVEERDLMRHLWPEIKGKDKTVQVEHVWNLLTKATSQNAPKRPVTWFEFLAACKRVAELQSFKTPSVAHTLAHTFDFSVFSPESFPCLVLEIWASEILKDNPDKAEELINQLSTRSPTSQSDTKKRSLLEWLEMDRGKPLDLCLTERYGNEEGTKPEYGYSLELYKTWLLLIEAIDFSELITIPNALSLKLKPRQVNASVIAARHWYKSACQFVESITEQELEANWLPVRLPGQFAVRGDWFLTVAGGSRSSRLADRALDLLSSKRANIIRLDEGIGLPVRRLFNDSEKDYHLQTRLITSGEKQQTDPSGEQPTNLSYEKQLTNLPYKEFLNIAARDDFYWLWRSNLRGYHSDIRIWHRWLNQMVVWWHSLRLKYASSWTSCFEIYAGLENIGRCKDKAERQEKCKELAGKLKNLHTWKEFQNMVTDLIDSLKQVSVESD